MTKIITLYNHKGGVSKTTTTFNLAHALAKAGNRVIVVDADPQCNFTELFMAPIIAKLDEEAEKTGNEKELPGTSILDALKPRFEGALQKVDVDKIQLVDSPFYPNVKLFRGDVELNAAEDDLSQAHSFRNSSQTHYKFTYVAVNDTLRRLGEREKADFILIDVGPSAGSITRTCFLSCDAFFVPVAPDRFNVQAIQTLSKIIDKWITEHSAVYDDFKELGLNIGLGKPFFLGAIIQNYKIARAGVARPGYQLWMKRIPERIDTTLKQVLKKHSTAERNLLALSDNGGIAVSIPDFGSMATCMQECSKPVYDLTQADTAKVSGDHKPYSGVVWDGTRTRMDEWRALFEKLVGDAHKLLKL